MPNGEHQKNSPVHSWCRVKNLTPRHLCKIPNSPFSFWLSCLGIKLGESVVHHVEVLQRPQPRPGSRLKPRDLVEAEVHQHAVLQVPEGPRGHHGEVVHPQVHLMSTPQVHLKRAPQEHRYTTGTPQVHHRYTTGTPQVHHRYIHHRYIHHRYIHHRYTTGTPVTTLSWQRGGRRFNKVKRRLDTGACPTLHHPSEVGAPYLERCPRDVLRHFGQVPAGPPELPVRGELRAAVRGVRTGGGPGTHRGCQQSCRTRSYDNRRYTAAVTNAAGRVAMTTWVAPRLPPTLQDT